MAEILGGMVVFLAFVVAGLWATVRAQRVEIRERDDRIASLIDSVPPRAVQFVVDPVGVFGDGIDERVTEPGTPPELDLRSMADERPTLA